MDEERLGRERLLRRQPLEPRKSLLVRFFASRSRLPDIRHDARRKHGRIAGPQGGLAKFDGRRPGNERQTRYGDDRGRY